MVEQFQGNYLKMAILKLVTGHCFTNTAATLKPLSLDIVLVWYLGLKHCFSVVPGSKVSISKRLGLFQCC